MIFTYSLLLTLLLLYQSTCFRYYCCLGGSATAVAWICGDYHHHHHHQGGGRSDLLQCVTLHGQRSHHHGSRCRYRWSKNDTFSHRIRRKHSPRQYPRTVHPRISVVVKKARIDSSGPDSNNNIEEEEEEENAFSNYDQVFRSIIRRSSTLEPSSQSQLQSQSPSPSPSPSPPLIPETSFGSELVPEGQRPVNEYLEMLRSPLFDWAVSDTKLTRQLTIVYVVFWVCVCWPIAGATFTEAGYGVLKFAAAHVGAWTVVWALLLRLYTGWTYIGERLTNARIEYEETGWFDGNVEIKSIAEQKRDKFLYQSQVQPVVQRLQRSVMIVSAVLVASIIGYQVVVARSSSSSSAHDSHHDPIFFDQYNPAVLERLSYDETLAETAAKRAASAQQPTYCDNRYYRAVAGGAPGCK